MPTDEEVSVPSTETKVEAEKQDDSSAPQEQSSSEASSEGTRKDEAEPKDKPYNEEYDEELDDLGWVYNLISYNV